MSRACHFDSIVYITPSHFSPGPFLATAAPHVFLLETFYALHLIAHHHRHHHPARSSFSQPGPKTITIFSSSLDQAGQEDEQTDYWVQSLLDSANTCIIDNNQGKKNILGKLRVRIGLISAW